MDRISDKELFKVHQVLITVTNKKRRFQGHEAFISLCFDLIRRANTMSKVNLHTSRASWHYTRTLLESLTSKELEEAASQQRDHKPITNPGVRALLNVISHIGSAAPSSDEKKSYMLAELKSLTVYHGCPTIYMTINPGDLHSPLCLKYCGVEIDIDNFTPELYSYGERLRVLQLQKNPLAVVEYFRNLVDTILSVLKQGLFGELCHYYGIFEYQGQKT